MNENRILRLGEKDVADVVGVLCDAFADYPVMRFVLGAGRPRYTKDLVTLIRFFAMARVLRGEFMFGIDDPDGLQAAALVSRPARESPPELTARREDLWRELGPEVRARYDAFAAASPVHLTTPHLHLHMIGVRHAAHGRGYARQLLDHVHAFSRGDPESNGVSLTTETEANLTLYRHFGYHLVGRMQVSPDLTTWGFFRRDDNAPRVAGLHVRKMQPDDREPLVELWERSVRATHHFLGEADIAGLRPYVAGALASHAVGWWVAESSANVLVGFLGFVDPVIDALFIDPEYFRQGAGKLLVAHAERLASGPLSLDVNEQNEDAVTFYTAMGFAVVGRSPTDSAGRPFPLLHMRRRQ